MLKQTDLGHVSQVKPEEYYTKKPWKKNLYENIGYPDNYTDESFLKELKKNINIKEVTYGQAFREAVKIVEKLCVLVWFLSIFSYLYKEWFSPQAAFMHTSIFVVFCYLCYVKFHAVPFRSVLGKSLQRVAIFLMLGYILSPALRTLTDTISTDTIYATTSLMMLIHLSFFDYNQPISIVSSSVSLNAAIFSSVCLASRLQSSFHAFVLLTISIEIFVLYPHFRNSLLLNDCYPFLLITVTFLSLAALSLFYGFMFILVTIFLIVICPMLFINWHKHKANIYGPWDEAMIIDDIK